MHRLQHALEPVCSPTADARDSQAMLLVREGKAEFRVHLHRADSATRGGLLLCCDQPPVPGAPRTGAGPAALIGTPTSRASGIRAGPGSKWLLIPRGLCSVSCALAGPSAVGVSLVRMVIGAVAEIDPPRCRRPPGCPHV